MEPEMTIIEKDLARMCFAFLVVVGIFLYPGLCMIENKDRVNSEIKKIVYFIFTGKIKK